FKNQRVITFKDIDRIHERPEGTAGRNFRENRKRFIPGIDFFFIKPSDVKGDEIRRSEINNAGTYLITESGYLMLVKSLTDCLAWRVQRELVNNYFRGKKVVQVLDNLSPQLQLLIEMELRQNQLEESVVETQREISNIKENIVKDVKDWRQWANDR